MSMRACRCWCHRDGWDCSRCEVDDFGVTTMPCPACLGKGELVPHDLPAADRLEPCDECAGTGSLTVPDAGAAP